METAFHRVAGVVVLVTALVVGIGTQPAAAFASTGTVTVDGWYYSSSYTDVTTYPTHNTARTESSTWISSGTCIDSWTGTTTVGTGQGATCLLELRGHHEVIYWDGTVQYSTGDGMRFNGGFRASNGATYTLRLGGDTGTLTGTASSSDGFAGPATVTYRGIAMEGSSCSSACYPDSYSTSQGPVLLTLDYVIH